MRDVVVAGAAMTVFGRFPDQGLKSLAGEAVRDALADAGASPADVQSMYFANVAAGLLQGQESTRGQHTLRETGLAGVPLVNIENACASGSTAVHQAWLAVASGHVDVALAVGVEKLTHKDKTRAFNAMTSALDQDRLSEISQEIGASGDDRSIFMDVYARWATWYAERTGATVEDFARVAAKNHTHGALNPKAQYRTPMTMAQVLAGRPVSGPLTAPMCAPIGDGAAAVLLTTPDRARVWDADPVRVLGTTLGCGISGVYGELVPQTARRAYDMAGVDPTDIDVVECHDATAPAELIVSEELGLCAPGDGAKLLRSGETTLGGRVPINPSGGLESKGHPLGATGIAQLVELVDQLRDRCGARQVSNARIALAENAGGYLGPDAAIACITILGRI